MSDERMPLLQNASYQSYNDSSNDPHEQFCTLVGVPSSNPPPGAKGSKLRPTSLYQRATRERRSQTITYMITASLSNTLLLTQVVLGATLTALGASESSHVLITVFGVMNTVIAGLVAYLKSRGQPMRARMYRDDMDRVVDEIENSEVMWLGISKGMLGYDELSADGEVTVRSEVARLTRLYDRAVKTNTMNNPDIYMAGGSIDGTPGGTRARPPPGPQPTVPVTVTQAAPLDADVPPAASSAPAALSGSAPAADPDESPATKAKPTPTPPPPPPPPPTKEAEADTPKDDKKGPSGASPSSANRKKADPAQTSHTDAPEQSDPPSHDTAKDASQADPSAEATAKPAADADDILDDPSNPTIQGDSKKTLPNSTSK